MAQNEFVVEQYYKHLQHVENYRFWFTNMFIIFTGSLVGLVLKEVDDIALEIGLSLIMVGFSYIGMRIAVKTGAVVAALSTNIGNIIGEMTEHNPYPVVEGGSISQAYIMLFVLSLVLWILYSLYNLYLLCPS